MSASRRSVEVVSWQLAGSQARLTAGALTGVVDVQQPDRGLTALTIGDATINGCLFSVSVETAAAKRGAPNLLWQPHDVYVRGRDLVASYREPLGEPFNLQVYWRVAEAHGEDSPVLDAIISIHTPEWEAYPCISVGSALPGGHALATAHSLVYRATPQWSYVEVTRPGDFTLSSGDAPGIGSFGARWRFGEQFMERGVIRRLHLRGGFVARENDEAYARRLQESLLAEQPPLTA